MENFKLMISKLIITIVIIASVISCIGGIVYLWYHGHETISYQLFQSEPQPFTSFFGIWQQAFSFSPKGVMQLGLLLLVVGQAVRVMLTTWLFAKENDYFFSFSSLFIFAVMMYSLFGYSL